MSTILPSLLTGISVAVVAALPVRAGFQFSAGFVDWFLSFNAPFAMNPILLIPIVWSHRERILIAKFMPELSSL